MHSRRQATYGHAAARRRDCAKKLALPKLIAAFPVSPCGAENRVTSDGRLGVYRTADAGESWELFSDGLPAPAWTVVLREASSFDGEGPVFGTQSGSVWALDGERWSEVARELPPVLSVEVGTWQ